MPAPALLSDPAMVSATGGDWPLGAGPWAFALLSELTPPFGDQRPPLQQVSYEPSLPIASTGQPSLASLQSDSSSGVSGCL